VAKKVTLKNLPSARTFGTTQTLTPTTERSQIEKISVQKGDKTHVIFKDGEFIKGVHPNQAQVVLYAVLGGLGSGRAQRPLGFAEFVDSVRKDFTSLSGWNAVIEFGSRGGTMEYPIKDLFDLCSIKVKNARVSFEKYPRSATVPRKTKAEPREVEVSITLD